MCEPGHATYVHAAAHAHVIVDVKQQEDRPVRETGSPSLTKDLSVPESTLGLLAPDGSDRSEFIPCSRFTGARLRHVFKLGQLGLGYYRDSPLQISEPAVGVHLSNAGPGAICCKQLLLTAYNCVHFKLALVDLHMYSGCEAAKPCCFCSIRLGRPLPNTSQGIQGTVALLLTAAPTS